VCVVCGGQYLLYHTLGLNLIMHSPPKVIHQQRQLLVFLRSGSQCLTWLGA
jgi:hypothetical protein